MHAVRCHFVHSVVFGRGLVSLAGDGIDLRGMIIVLRCHVVGGNPTSRVDSELLLHSVEWFLGDAFVPCKVRKVLLPDSFLIEVISLRVIEIGLASGFGILGETCFTMKKASITDRVRPNASPKNRLQPNDRPLTSS